MCDKVKEMSTWFHRVYQEEFFYILYHL